MTGNEDVEWLRAELEAWKGFSPEDRMFKLNLGYFRRLIAHIDQLEARLNITIDNATEREMELAHKLDIAERRPTVHEIAARVLPATLRICGPHHDDAVQLAYDAAEALVAEGRRRDGL